MYHNTTIKMFTLTVPEHRSFRCIDMKAMKLASLLFVVVAIALGAPVGIDDGSGLMWKPLVNNFSKPPPQHMGVSVLREVNNNENIREFVTWGGISSGNTQTFDTPWFFKIDRVQQWATSPGKSSTSYCTTSGQWCTEQAFGPPESISCGDFDSAWAPRPAGDGMEYLDVSFAVSGNATKLEIFETYNSPFCTEVILFDELGKNHSFPVQDNTTTCPGVLSIVFDPPTPYYVVRAEIRTSSSGWEEINAIRLSSIVTNVIESANGTVSSPKSSNPPSLNGAVAGYDKNRDRMVIFGGRSSTYSDLTYSFDFTTNIWKKLTFNSQFTPPVLHGASSIVVFNGLLVFGGRCGDRCYSNSLYFLDFSNDTWHHISDISKNKPLEGYGHSLTLINGTHAAAFGGESSPTDDGYIMSNDLFLLDTQDILVQNMTRWKLMNSSSVLNNRPSIRSFASAVSMKSKLYIIAGKHVKGQAGSYVFEFLSDLWCFDFQFDEQHWSLLSDKAIPTRAESVATTTENGFIVYGGRSSTESLFTSGTLRDDMWQWNIDLKKWSKVGGQPEERVNHGSALMENKLLIVGGERPVSKTSKSMLSMTPLLIELNHPYTTTTLSVSGSAPEARAGMSVVLLNSDRVLLFGGYTTSSSTSSTSFNNELWELRLSRSSDTWSWAKITPSGDLPSPRAFHTAVITNRKMVVFGGLSTAGPLNSLWELDLSVNLWKLPSIASSSNAMPVARWGHAAMTHTDGMVVVGGSKEAKGLGELNDAWLYVTGNSSWVSLGNVMRSGSTGHRLGVVGLGSSSSSQPIAMVHGGSTFRRGRYSGDVTFVDGMMYLWSSSTSTVDISSQFMSLADPYSYLSPGRYGHSLITLGKKVFVWGGQSVESKALNDLSVFEGGDDWKCGPGTYVGGSGSGNDCVLCPAGTYSSEFGATKCKPCPMGFYGESKGGTGPEFSCIPCPLGTVGKPNGQCKACSSVEYCGLGSTHPIPILLQNTHTQLPRNPLPLENKEEDVQNAVYYLIVVASSLMGAILFIMLCIRLWSKPLWQRFMQPLDLLFTSKHSQKLNEPLKPRKTVMGGALTVLFLFTAILMVAALVIPFVMNNVVEQRALLPARIFEVAVKTNMTVSVTFYGAASSRTCSKEYVSVESNNILSRSTTTTPSTSSFSDQCTVLWECIGCQLTHQSASVRFNFKSDAGSVVGSNAIEWMVNSTSGIDSKVSSINGVLTPAPNTIFRGAHPSIVTLKAVPVVLNNEVSFTNSTGYQLGLMQVRTGSNATTATYHYSEGLSVELKLAETETVLQIERRNRQNIQGLLASFLGSMSGLMGGFALLLFVLELSKEKIKKLKSSEHEDQQYNIRMTMLKTPPDLEGTLLKKQRSASMHVWGERYFSIKAVKGPMLNWSHSSTTTTTTTTSTDSQSPMSSFGSRATSMLKGGYSKAKGVDLINVVSIEADPNLEGLPEKKRAFGFVVVLNANIGGMDRLELCASTSEQLQYWIRGLNMWLDHDKGQRRRRAGASDRGGESPYVQNAANI